MKRLAVYCGSASPEDPRYVQLAYDVGAELADRGIGLVYGGGKLGLMGAVAKGAKDAGGEVIGIIPEHLVKAEVANHDCDELVTVSGMHERKQRFTDLSDGFITIPGGVGTMDELWEAMSWSQLGYHSKPCGLLNVAGYYDQLLAFLDHCVAQGFVHPKHRSMVLTDTEPARLIDQLSTFNMPQVNKWLERGTT